MIISKIGTSQVNSKNKKRFQWEIRFQRENCYQDTVEQMGVLGIKMQMLNLIQFQEF